MNNKGKSWLFRIRVKDQPGVMASIATTFSRRGIQVESFNAQGKAVTLGNDKAEAVIQVGFMAYDYRMRSLERVLSRLQSVDRVDVCDLSDGADAIKTATVRYQGEQADVENLLAHVIVDTAFMPKQTLLIHGPQQKVDQALDVLDAADGIIISEAVVLPPS